ncbi:hypothetical protein [Mycolicibacterium septicum]|uniref:hypothetical protein n=1 Tax=Mycolicibacterium septicum TaxID=98668 RepID=UPI0005C92D8E|nr:hypothetical protein [Mycolicibacterium septicum]
MAGAAQPDRYELELMFEQIAEVIDRQQRSALTEHAMAEQLWQCVADAVTECAGPESVVHSRHAA